MTGKWVRGGARGQPREGVVLQVRPFELHGTQYYALQFKLDAEDQVREARLSHDMTYEDVSPGDRVLVDLVLGVVDRVRKQPA